MRMYNRVMLGQGSKFAKMCREENYIGADFEIFMDLTDFLYDNWRDFNEKFIPVWMQNVPGKSKTSAGLACGFLWTIVKGLKIGDVVLSPSGEGFYYVGVISSDYYYVPDTDLPHRRNVQWMDKVIYRKDMSKELRNSSGSIGTCCNLTDYAQEIEALLDNSAYIPEVKAETATSSTESHGFDERSLHKVFCLSQCYSCSFYLGLSISIAPSAKHRQGLYQRCRGAAFLKSLFLCC